jgi:hypothetical protein
VTTTFRETDCIVRHGDDYFAASYDQLEEAALEYDQWVDLLHARDN